MDPGQPQLRRRPPAHGHGEDPRADDERKHQTIEFHVDRERGVELDRVERHEPQQSDEGGEHPRQHPRCVRPVAAVSGLGSCGTSGSAAPIRCRRSRIRYHNPPAASPNVTKNVRAPMTSGIRAPTDRHVACRAGGAPGSSPHRTPAGARAPRGSRASHPRRRSPAGALRPRSAPACKRRGPASRAGPAPRSGISTPTPGCRSHAARSPGSVKAVGTFPVVRARPDSSVTGMCAYAAIRSSTGGLVRSRP